MSEVRSGKDRVTGAIEFAVKVVALGVPVFYALGRLYADGYWGRLGLSSSLMAPGVEDYLYFGFLSILLPLARLVGVDPYTPIGYAVLIALGLAVFVVIARLISNFVGAWAKARMGAVNDRFSAWAKEQKFVTKQVLLLASVWAFVAFVLMGIIWCVLVLLLPLALASHEGTHQAELTDARLRDPAPTRPRNQAEFLLGGVAKSAPLLDCSERWCIVLTDTGYVAIPIGTVTQVRVLSRTKRKPHQ